MQSLRGMGGGGSGAWSGLMPFSKDGGALVGSLGPICGCGSKRGLWVAAGFGPHGIMEGPGAMKLLISAVISAVDP